MDLEMRLQIPHVTCDDNTTRAIFFLTAPFANATASRLHLSTDETRSPGSVTGEPPAHEADSKTLSLSRSYFVRPSVDCLSDQ